MGRFDVLVLFVCYCLSVWILNNAAVWFGCMLLGVFVISLCDATIVLIDVLDLVCYLLGI